MGPHYDKVWLMLPFKAVLWDMDGTLIDSERYWLEAEIEMMREFDVIWSEEDQANCLGGPMSRVQNYMAQRANYVKEPAFFGDTLREKMVEKLSRTIDFAPGAAELLSSLQEANIAMALVTASSRKIVAAAMQTIGADTFPVTISGDDVVHGKPDPEGYLSAAQQLGVAITDCIILEDSFVGTSAAIASGAVVIGISHLGTLANSKNPNSGNMVVVSSLSEISIADLSNIYRAQSVRW